MPELEINKVMLYFVKGSYLLDIAWSDHPVKGSPFKVTVDEPRSIASKVVCTGDGLRTGGVILGQDIQSVIDTRGAGSGNTLRYIVGLYFAE